MNALDHAKALISKPSVSPDDGGCQTYLNEQLKALGFTIHNFDQEDTKNTLAILGEGSPSILFVGHTDVVPVGAIDAWQSDPFLPTVINNRLVGRGAVDMKSSLAAMLSAQQHLLKNNRIKGSLAWLITSDEEASGTHGMKAVVPKLKKAGFHFDYAIVGEPASNKQLSDTIKIGRRGSLHLTLTSKGKQGHVAYPDDALNPNNALIQALHALLQTTWDTEDTAPFPKTQMQITALDSGAGASNVIPQTATAVLNFRFPACTPHTLLIEVTEGILKSYPTITCSWQLSAKPYYSPEGSLVATCKHVFTKHGIDDVAITTTGGTSDGRFLAPICKEIVEIGPCHTEAHQCNESIGLDELEQLSALYQEILAALLAVDADF